MSHAVLYLGGSWLGMGLVRVPLSFPLENLPTSTGASAALLPVQPMDARR